MCKTVDIRKLQRRAETEYGRLLDLASDIRSVVGGEHHMASRATKAAHEMYSLMNALNLRAINGRDRRGRYPLTEAERSV